MVRPYYFALQQETLIWTVITFKTKIGQMLVQPQHVPGCKSNSWKKFVELKW